MNPGVPPCFGHPELPLPSIEEVIALTLALGSLTNPDIRCAGISLNTMHMDEATASAKIKAASNRFGLPAADPIRAGEAFERLLDACMA